MDLCARTLSVMQAICLGLSVSMGVIGCSTEQSDSPAVTAPSPNAANATNVDFDAKILSNFVDQVVIPNHASFATEAKGLAAALDTLAEAPTQANLKAAQSAWMEARAPWEQSEGFTFGPATSAGYDGSLDSWPVNENDFKAMLASSSSLDIAKISKMSETEKGFHVIEYFLFGPQNNRKVVDLKPRDLQYIRLLGQSFAATANNLQLSWTKGVDGKPAYREVFVTAGKEGNGVYPTTSAAAAEMIQGMLDSLDEVANEKMNEPFVKQDPKLAESRFSQHTLTDMKHNIQGAQNVYLGIFPGSNGNADGLSTFVAQAKPDVDATVKAQFETAMAAMEKIPAPFETAIQKPEAAAAIKAAVAAISEVRKTIETQVKPLVVKS
jgi:putative iron-regulated protein